MLPEIIKYENIGCEKIIAEVFKTNIASNKIFLSAGYQKRDRNEMSIYEYKTG